ncbi:MAG: type I glyceraldehyde-3-phosphate dehydrogenase, partial [Candidatus Hydrothermarchaeota archaeon]
VLPELEGKLDAISLRVPVPCGSINDLVVELEKEASAEEINSALKKASENELKGILQYIEEPVVSRDIIGNPHSAIVDGLLTKTNKNLAKVLAWYDNEWGFSNRMIDLIKYIAERM